MVEGPTERQAPLVLVTGATGFVASHVVEAVLAHGYRVRGTARNPADGRKCGHLNRLRAEGKPVEVVKADLLTASDWPAAVRGCDFVVHTASPATFTLSDELIVRTAVEGTMTVLRAAATEGVKRVCLTSSMVAVAMSREEYLGSDRKPLTEQEWTDPTHACGYAKSKVLAERAAWDFIRGPENKGGMELAVIIPGWCYGPVLNDYRPSEIAESMVPPYKIMKGVYPFATDFYLPAIDIRDVAEAHVRTLEVPEAAGERFMIVDEVVHYLDLCKHLRKLVQPLGYWWVPSRSLPNIVALGFVPFDPQLRAYSTLLGVKVGYDGSKARRVLGMGPYRSGKQAFVAAALSFVQQGKVPQPKKLKAALKRDPQALEKLLA